MPQMPQRPLEIIVLRPKNEIGVAVCTERFEDGYLTAVMHIEPKNGIPP